ncbi:MAG: DUF58 domain-containing protein [Verrucomicrobiota bacterium]
MADALQQDQADRTREIIKKVRQIEIRTNRLVNDSLAGEYHSVFKGRGMDFDEVREYSPGDEVRMIDWNVTARSGVPHVKKFTEERELTILLLVDLSASGSFGSGQQSKRELAAEVASTLAFSAISNKDKVGLVLFTDQIEAYIPPAKGRQHVLRVVREILFFEPRRRGTDIAMALDFVNQVRKRKAVVFLLSDFCLHQEHQGQLTVDRGIPVGLEALRPALNLTGKRHDLIAVHIQDRNEQELPNLGLLTVEDAETGEQFEIDTGSEETRVRFAALARDRLEAVRKLTRSCGVQSLELKTGQSYVTALLNFFSSRGRRRR